MPEPCEVFGRGRRGDDAAAKHLAKLFQNTRAPLIPLCLAGLVKRDVVSVGYTSLRLLPDLLVSPEPPSGLVACQKGKGNRLAGRSFEILIAYRPLIDPL